MKNNTRITPCPECDLAFACGCNFCPDCGRRVVGAEIFSSSHPAAPEEKAPAGGTVYCSLDDAIRHICNTPQEQIDPAAWAYMFEHAPAVLREMLHDVFAETYPDLKPTHIAEDGTPFYSIDTLVEHLGMSREEIEAAVKQMPESCYRKNLDGMDRIQ